MGLFGHLQVALPHTGTWVCFSCNFHQELSDWCILVHSLWDDPTDLHELIPQAPNCFGAHDANGINLGSVFWDQEN